MDRTASLVAIYKELDQYKADQQEISAILALPDFRTSKANNKPDNYDITIKPFAREKLTNQHTIYIPYGTHVAIIGSTGEGKTTLANIIAGTLKTNNVVHIGTSDIANLSEKAMVNTVSYAYQDPDFLFGDFNNSILFNTLKIKPKELKSLLVDLQLDKTLDIQHLNQNIPVSTLSGGEAKRLALLRTLITKKPITIIDEPTSAMDRKTATIVWKVLQKAFHKKTLICITHDKQLLSNFDIVLAVRNHSLIPTKK